MAPKRLDHPLAVHAASANTRIELFGRARVLRADAEVRLSPLQLSLVALVYGHGQAGVDRTTVADLLWSCEPDVDVRHRLRQLLVELRERVETKLVEADGDRLVPAQDVSSDLREVEAALARDELHPAAVILKRGFCASGTAEVTDGFIDWRDGVAQTMGRRLGGRAAAKWSRSSHAGDWRSARDAAEAFYALDPSSVDAIEKVIEASGRVGDFSAAERVFASYLETTDSSVGPDVSIERTMGRVRRLAAASPGYGEGTASAPFVGRADSLERARWLFDCVDENQFGFVLISGESGIGKTRLLKELQREALFRDFRCLSAQAVELESRIPLNPLLDALEEVDLQRHLDALGQPWNAVIGAVLPTGTLLEPAGELPFIQETSLSRRLLDALALLMGRLASEQKTILFLDDLQWADATTVAALQFIQRRWSGGPLGIIATIRPELVGPSDPTATYLRATDGLAVRRVELSEFSQAEALQLVNHLGGETIGEDRSRWLCELACLHPLYLTELTRDYLVGRLRIPQQAADAVTIPVSLEQILETRFQSLSDEAMKVAGLLAAAARPVRASTLASVSDLPLEIATDAVDELSRARLAECEHDRIRISHELFRSAIYRRLGDVRRAIIHRVWAEHISEDASEDAAGELAIHYARAGDRELAAKYGWLAADRAMETGTVAEAGHFFQLVFDNERNAVRRAESAAGLARSLRLGRDLTRANPALELAADALRSVGKAADALRLEIHRVEGLAEIGAAAIGALMEKLGHLKQQATARGDWEAVALVLDAELHLLYRAGDVVGIQSLFGEMRDVASKGCLEATLLAHAGLALGVLFGDPNEALESANRAIELSLESRNYRLMSLLRLIVVLQHRGMLELPSAAEVLNEARALAERSGDVLLRFSIESNLAVAALDAGDPERAQVLMARSTAALGSAEMDLSRFHEANNRAELAMAQHDFAKAAGEYIAASPYVSPTSPAYVREIHNAGLGLCALETGDLSEARRREQELSKSSGPWYFDPTTILAFRVRLLDHRRQTAAALELLEAAADDVKERLVLAWFKIRALQVRLMLKRRLSGAAGIALEARNRAGSLHLWHRVWEFDGYLDALRERRLQ